MISNDPAYIRKALEASLRRLNVETIDLYYMHRRDPDVPLTDSIGTLAEFLEEGKIRHLGLSEVSGDELREAHALHPITAVESEWSLFSRDAEDTTVPVAVELGVALVPYSPLGCGFLAGAFTDAATDLAAGDARVFFDRFTGDNTKTNAALLKPLDEIAAAHDATRAQIALAWAQQRAAVHHLTVVPIPGTRSRRTRLRDNVAATWITRTPAAPDRLPAQRPGRPQRR